MLDHLIDPDVDTDFDRAWDWFCGFKKDAEAQGVDWIGDDDLVCEEGEWGFKLCGQWVFEKERADEAISRIADKLAEPAFPQSHWYDVPRALAQTVLWLCRYHDEDAADYCISSPRKHAACYLSAWREEQEELEQQEARRKENPNC